MSSTSRVFDAPRAVKTALEALSIPAVGTLDPPVVSLAEPEWDAYAEHIWVHPEAGEDSEIRWVSNCARDEQFDIVIEFITATGETDEDTVWERLETVCDLIQRAFYDDTTNTITPIAGATKLDGVAQVSVRVGHADPVDGLLGVAQIIYRPHFRI